MATWKKVIVSGSNAELNQITASGAIVPSADAGANLGSTTLEWNNLYIDGTANIDSLVADTADINGGTVDGITSLTAGGDLDIGAHEFRAETFESDVSTGTAPFTVASTTAVTNLQAATVATIAGLAPNTATTQATQGSITSIANLVTIGTIGTGVWQGTAVASAYLDSDTAHLTTNQTFSGIKTFSKGTTFTAAITGSGHVTASGNVYAADYFDNGTNISAIYSPIAGGSGILTTGTIGTGVWQGTAVASAYLDSDTAHLTTTQTFTGLKTFSKSITASIHISAVGTLFAATASIGGGTFTSASLAEAVASSISAGDITSVVAGDGLQDGGTSGDVTLNIDVSDFVSTGLEATGEDIRLATQGTGISGGGGSTLSITPGQTAITSIINSSLAKIGTAAAQEYITFGTSNEVNTFINNGEVLSVTANGVDITGTAAISSNLTVTGDLTVNGTTTTIATTNTEISDQFLFLASGSDASNVDAGIIVQSGSFRGSGSALYHDKSTERWAVAKGVAKSAAGLAQTHLQYIATVGASAVAPNATSGSYGVGEMWIETDTQDIFVRTA